MKRLTILRHAKSSWAESGQLDFDRPLNERGFRDLKYMPEAMLKMVGKPDMILSSSANRAQTTARDFAVAFGMDLHTEKNLYHAEVDTLIQHAKRVSDQVDHLLLVAHNPGLTWLANQLGQNFAIDNLPTCAFVSFDFDMDTWADLKVREGKFVAYDYPKNH